MKWWDRELVGFYLSPVSLEHDVLRHALNQDSWELVQHREERS